MNAVLKYPGAKNKVAKWICSYIPEHKVYLELFGGSMAVLLNKQRSHIETVNDLHGEVVNYFRVLRDQPEKLKHAIEMTPYSRQEYKESYMDAEDEIERARRFCIRCWMGFGASNLYMNGFKTGQQTNSPNPAKAWAELPLIIGIAAERMQGVQIENLPALELLSRYDTKDVFIYADPPYLPGTRKSKLYRYEMTVEDHMDLLAALLSHPGSVLLSGYDNDVYNNYLAGWTKAYKNTTAEGGVARTEVLWMNYEPMQQMKLFSERSNKYQKSYLKEDL